MRRVRTLLPVVAIAALVAACVPTKPPAPDPCEGPDATVSPANLCGWTEEQDQTGAGDFVTGPATPPAGDGSYQLSSGGDADGGGEARLLSPVFLERLDALTSLSYSTLITDYAGGGSAGMDLDNRPWLTAALVLAVDLDGDPITTSDDQVNLVFEPCYSDPTNCATAIQALNEWNDWQTIGADKLWWVEAPAMEVHCGGLPAAPGGAEFKNLQALILDDPDCADALVFQITLRAGQVGGGAPWLDFTGAVDRLILDGSGPEGTFDFEA